MHPKVNICRVNVVAGLTVGKFTAFSPWPVLRLSPFCCLSLMEPHSLTYISIVRIYVVWFMLSACLNLLCVTAAPHPVFIDHWFLLRKPVIAVYADIPLGLLRHKNHRSVVGFFFSFWPLICQCICKVQVNERQRIFVISTSCPEYTKMGTKWGLRSARWWLPRN